MRPRLFGKDPDKELIRVVLPPGSPRPEWTANSDRTRPGQCPDCDGYGSFGFFTGDGEGNVVAGRAPCTNTTGWHS